VIRRVALLFVPFVLFLGSNAQAQLQTNFFGLAPSGIGAPNIPASGDWAEIVTVTSKWIVIQNQKGQQFPVSLDSIAEAMIRWPIDPSRISSNAMLEATGLDLASNGVQTDHVDVFEGNARGLVRPIYQKLIGFNRKPTAMDMLNVGLYGFYGIPMLPGEEMMPNRLHVAGPIAAMNPLRLVADSNNTVPIVPADGGITFTQVTPATISYLRAGDLLYVVPADMNQKTLILSQLVGYKAMALSNFVP
jgi:hypothetical protein